MGMGMRWDGMNYGMYVEYESRGTIMQMHDLGMRSVCGFGLRVSCVGR